MKNEKTSKRIARNTAQITNKLNGLPASWWISATRNPASDSICTVGILRQILMSNLTQVADKMSFTSRAEVRKAVKKLRPFTVDASTIPELGETFADKPKRKAKKARRGKR